MDRSVKMIGCLAISRVNQAGWVALGSTLTNKTQSNLRLRNNQPNLERNIGSDWCYVGLDLVKLLKEDTLMTDVEE